MNLKNIDLCKGVDLSGYFTIKIGGVADNFFKIHNSHDLTEILRDFGPHFYVLGNGSNILMNEAAIIKPVVYLSDEFNYCRQEYSFLEVGAATPLPNLLNYCMKNDIGGFSQLAGIPAKIGGLIQMNASAYGKSISDNLLELEVADKSGEIKFIKKEDIDLNYRSSSLKGLVVLKARFSVIYDFCVYKDINYYLKKRLVNQDLLTPSCGCIFKNPQTFSAGALIDFCGLKGTVRGGARISDKHANFIINVSRATYNDVDYLIQNMRDKVFKKHNILLEEEIHRWV
jgi:UDP-N-acetylmuramate dehydrogenase